ARRADRINRTQVVLVAASCKGEIEIHSQRGPEERPFHIVNGEGISGEETIDIARLDEADQMLAGAGPHDCRSRNDRDLSICYARPLQFLTKLADDRRLRFVRINDCVDELKEISARRRTLNWNNTNSVMSHHDLISLTDVEKLDRPGSAFFSVNRNCAVHHGGTRFALF